MKVLLSNKSGVVVVDDEDFEIANKWKWSIRINPTSGKKYAVRMTSLGVVNGKRKRGRMSLHRFLMRPPKDRVIDHIDGNPLNNQRNNLRICTQQQNLWNSRRFKKGTSSFKGVSKHKRTGRWRSHIHLNDKQIHLGYFSTEKLAAYFYNKAAVSLFGEYANLNVL
jgi:hypothetical protein